MNPQDIPKHIEEIGNEMVSCTMFCRDIRLQPQLGIIPHGLVVENGLEPNARGCTVIGVNPGAELPQEQKDYLSNGRSYASTVAYFNNNYGFSGRHYPHLRNLARQSGIRGMILWTDIVKCESKEKNSIPSPQTRRVCISRFLRRELASVPLDWPIFAVGKDAWITLTYVFFDRTIIGLPNPGSSRGHFSSLFSDKRLKQKFLNILTDVYQRHGAESIWISGK